MRPNATQAWLDQDTVDDESFYSEDSSPRVCFTILAHPDVTRVGEVSFPGSTESGPRSEKVKLSRLEPQFSPLAGGRSKPLADAHLSRSPISLERRGATWKVDCSQGTRLEINGVICRGEAQFDDVDLEDGVVLLLGKSVCLLLHRRSEATRSSTRPEALRGESDAMLDVFSDIARLARVDVPVLIRGETGTGKELTARAIHDASERSQGPFVAVNMATLPPSLAAAELFGAARGAFTGSTRSRAGLFRAAASGTLFLDEVAATPPEVQALLLRAIEDRTIRSVGSEDESDVDLRILAATDARLEEAVEQGEFREPLLQRLSAYVIHLPALRKRREDIGRLFFPFLTTELEKAAGGDSLDGNTSRPWLPAAVLAALALDNWPGNVRQLRNVATRLAVRFHDRQRLKSHEVLPWLQEQLSTPADPSRPAPAPPSQEATPRHQYRDPADVSEDELIDCLRTNQWQIRPSAKALNLSRGSLYSLVAKSDRIRKAKDLSASEIEKALKANDHKIEAAAQALEVSKEGLKIRMTELENR